MLHIDFYLIEDLFVKPIIEYKQYVQNIQIYYLLRIVEGSIHSLLK